MTIELSKKNPGGWFSKKNHNKNGSCHYFKTGKPGEWSMCRIFSFGYGVYGENAEWERAEHVTVCKTCYREMKRDMKDELATMKIKLENYEMEQKEISKIKDQFSVMADKTAMDLGRQLDEVLHNSIVDFAHYDDFRRIYFSALKRNAQKALDKLPPQKNRDKRGKCTKR